MTELPAKKMLYTPDGTPYATTLSRPSYAKTVEAYSNFETANAMSDRELANTLKYGTLTVDQRHAMNNEVAARLNIDPDDTEQGFTEAAWAKVRAYIEQHTDNNVTR